MLPSIRELFLVFLKLGATGFGGPLALVAAMDKEIVARRSWVSRESFDEGFVYCKLLPGPIAYQMALWLGLQIRGRIGGLVAGFAFLAPAWITILILSVFYQELKHTTQVQPIVEGFRIGALVIIFESLIRMCIPYQRQLRAWLFIAVAMGLMWVMPRWEPLIILSGGFAMWFAKRSKAHELLGVSLVTVSLLSQLFWVHFIAGATVFGTGLAIIPFLERAVALHGWMSQAEFLDAISLGQITPGPLTIASVFVGFRVAGFPGAFSAGAGMYFPGLVLVLVLLPAIREKMRRAKGLVYFQDGAIPMVIGCVLAATLWLSRSTLVTSRAVVLSLLLAFIVWRTRISGWLVIPLGALLNWLAVFL